jgi:hypothetical protein
MQRIPSEIITLSGGLGNQMFQYAFFLARKEYNKDVVLTDYLFCFGPDAPHNGYELTRLFHVAVCKNTGIRNLIRLIRKLLIFRNKKGFRSISSFLLWALKKMNIHIITEESKESLHHGAMQKQPGVCIYMGHWQKEAYFLFIKQKVSDAFSFEKLAKSPGTREIRATIKKTASVSIHIRRGDFLLEEEKFGNICTHQYYERAIAEIERRVESPVFFVFSDDMQWVRENLRIPHPCHYIDWNQGRDSWQDMYLMSECRHHIIANSTFSWWGAWLDQSPQKIVITPGRFLNNTDTSGLIPDNWITV